MRYAARVLPGRGQGRKLGFPTLNLEIPPGFAAEHGVYAGRAWIDGMEMPAAFHYGPVPVFGIAAASLEAHVIGADIPEAPARLEFELVKYLREVKGFENPEALARQIQLDVQAALTALREAPGTGAEGV